MANQKWETEIAVEMREHPGLIWTEAQVLVRERIQREFPLDLGVTAKCPVKYTGKAGSYRINGYTATFGEHVLCVSDDVAHYLLRNFTQGKPHVIFAKMEHGIITNCCVYEF